MENHDYFDLEYSFVGWLKVLPTLIKNDFLPTSTTFDGINWSKIYFSNRLNNLRKELGKPPLRFTSKQPQHQQQLTQ